MPLVGDIQTMPLVELLQWVASNKKTGLLELERNKIHKQISFQQGRVVGCFDDDPSMRLGQFLISRGKITEQTLQLALRQQGVSGDRIPDILVDTGALTRDEIAEQVKAKALETIYGVFEWSDAIFRFKQDCAIDRYEITVDLSIERILLEGATREDELKLFRGKFASSGIVLRRTEQPLEPGENDGALLSQVLELVDGKRSLAEILTQAHASEYHVLKLLFNLVRTRNIEIVAERVADAGAATLIDVRTDAAPIPLPSVADFAVQPDPTTVDAQPDVDRPGAASPAELYTLLAVSAEKLANGDHEGGLAVLDACYRSRPHDESLRKQMARTEKAYLAKLACGPLQPDRVPQRIDSAEQQSAGLQPDQTTVLGMIDGQRAIQSLLWVAPLREIQVFRALRRLLDLDLIRTIEADESQIEAPEELFAAEIDASVANALEFDTNDA